MSGVRSTLLVPLGRSMCNLRTSVSRNAILHRGQIFFERLSRQLYIYRSEGGVDSGYDHCTIPIAKDMPACDGMRGLGTVGVVV